MTELNWGILGAGLISEDFARALNQCVNKHKVVAVGASAKEKAQRFVEKCELKDASVYDYQGVLDDPHVAVVYIGLMNHQHKEWCLKAFEKGKAVLCEKPLTPNYHETKIVVDKAKESKLFFMEGFWSRSFPVYKLLREEINQKKLGGVKSVFATFGTDSLYENRFKPEIGATPVSDIGVYTVALAQWIFNNEKPEKITAEGHVENGCDLWGTIVLKYSGNRKAVLTYSGIDYTPIAAMITCENGRYDLPENFYCPTSVTRYESTGLIRGNQRRVEKKVIEFDNFEKDKTDYNFVNCSGIRYEADHVFECLQQGKTESPLATHEDTLRIVQIIDEVRRQLGVVYGQDKE